MPMSISCPVCGDADHLRVLCRVGAFDITTCATCKADHASPMPPATELKAYYDRREWFEGGEAGGYQNYDAQTGWSLEVVTSILAEFGERKDLSILDVGCGYGTHLALAAERGWKCFGIEPSDHARGVAHERLGDQAYVVENVTDMIPHAFDLVLMLDTLEHLTSPYPTLYHLFSIGAITPQTRLVITTPNAASIEATRDPAAWAYRHPPSHLIFYTADTLTYLLRRLQFTNVTIKGISPQPDSGSELSAHNGLMAVAEGSNFTEFMRERYVPGTWSKIAEYEHVPRYALAKTLVKDKAVLDFGCGTGYGAALLAEAAGHVTALDIDVAAIQWSQQTHHLKNLKFILADDLGAALPEKSFDIITCFEMIEHVDHATQKAVIASFARLLRDDGVLLISTPNPETTKLYGANPYHIREMTEAELRELLEPYFPHSQILRQHVDAGVSFADVAQKSFVALPSNDHTAAAHPLAFIGLASRRPLSPIKPHVLFDRSEDYISSFLMHTAALNRVRIEAFSRTEQLVDLKNRIRAAGHDRDQTSMDREQALMALNEANFERDRAVNARELALYERHVAATERDEAINTRERALYERHLASVERDEAINTRERALYERHVAATERDEAINTRERALHERHVAATERDDAINTRERALHERYLADVARYQAIAERDVVVAERDVVIAERAALVQKIGSLRFLARQLYHTVRLRVRQKFGRLFSR